MSANYLIAGLGNPGRRYKKTRHNIGFMVIDQLAKSFNGSLETKAHMSELTTVDIADHQVILAKPMTYMNRSGDAISEIATHYKVRTDHILIVYDEAALEFGRLRIKGKGSSGGHNGLESILQELETQNVPRLRIGIGSEKAKKNMVKFVLSKFNRNEKKQLPQVITLAEKTIISFISNGLEKTMNTFNTKQKPISYQEE